MDFVGKRAWFFLLSALIIAPGIAFLVIGGGLKPGIDFTGGSTTGLEFATDVQQEDLRSELTSLGYEDAIVQRMDDQAFFVRTKELNEDEKDGMVAGLESRLSPDGVNVLSL